MADNEKRGGGWDSRQVSVVIPVWNQVEYTRGCLESLQPDLAAGAEVVLVNNGSTDGTRELLATLKDATVVSNDTNRGCAAAWNQGVAAASREWIVVLNNDVVLGPDWLKGMISYAEENNLHVVTPGIREGPLNYALPDYATDFVREMKEVERRGVANGICFMVRRAVFEKIGPFDENFRIGQFEDADFFLRAKAAGFQLGTTGRAFLHHYGSITQKAIRPRAGPYEAENRAYYRKKWGLTAPRRLAARWRSRAQTWSWRAGEWLRHRHTLHEKWMGGRLHYF